MLKKLSVLGLTFAISATLTAQTVINGAGASFPAPVYQSWTYTYSQTGPSKVNYQSVGSGAGVNQLKAKTVDFAGTDNPLTKEDQEKEGMEQFPMLLGGVVVIVNLPGVKTNELKLERSVLADIFLGKITSWDDARIAKANSGLKLPKTKITVVRRADSSGTSFIFTNYLSKISKEWETKVGAGASVNWPVGIGGQKNPGICNNVAKIRGSIGYTEYTYAVEANLACAAIENQTGKFITADVDSFRASAANAEWDKAPGFYMVLTDQPGEQSWPITGVTYILIRKDADPAMRQAMINYFNWCFTTGATAAQKLNYVPMPENVVKMVEAQVFKK
ncbi:MAG TPA: phosphate ABC transporter substrate-binding protein PstS [Lentisphaeria bacterium]|nr:phosphate ABC transporter substrate-binding protein PstS [Lentisphaerota bacterium]OQC17144.1 MAG: Phosphate-binding protein PstS precursor [Lentisphaerae bacterium ADurb.Bin082]HQC51546.1 phosphate ABC transporter substrate-binding protein PstS [Lentisphaeria bacterium]